MVVLSEGSEEEDQQEKRNRPVVGLGEARTQDLGGIGLLGIQTLLEDREVGLEVVQNQGHQIRRVQEVDLEVVHMKERSLRALEEGLLVADIHPGSGSMMASYSLHLEVRRHGIQHQDSLSYYSTSSWFQARSRVKWFPSCPEVKSIREGMIWCAEGIVIIYAYEG